MFYRVVMQGRTLGSADVAEVKYDFVRVTGLPAKVVEEFFGGMPRVIMRQVSQSDAERIASTLRAIGAAATIEREMPGSQDKQGDSVNITANPFNGPPTIIPGSQATVAAPSRRPRWMRNMRDHMPLILGVGALVGIGVLSAPFIDDLISNSGRVSSTAVPSTAAPKKAAAQADPLQAVDTMNPRFLHGPWRCTDQRTGVANYWTYDADGSMVYNGEVLSDKPAPKVLPAGTPVAWKLDGARLSVTSTERPVTAYTVAELSLSRLRYGDDAGLEIQCRRP